MDGGAGSSGGAGAPAVDLLGGDLLGDDTPPASAPASSGGAQPEPAAAAPPPPAPAPAIDDLLGGMSIGSGAAAAAPVAAAVAAADDPFGLLGGDVPAAPAASQLPVLLGGEKGKGLTVRGRVVQHAGAPAYELSLSNGSSGPLDGFMLQLNSNAFGLAPANQVVPVGTLAPGGSGSAFVPLAINPAKVAAAGSQRLQVRGSGMQCAGEQRRAGEGAALCALQPVGLLVLRVHPYAGTHVKLQALGSTIYPTSPGRPQDHPAGRLLLGRRPAPGRGAGGGRHHRRHCVPQRLARPDPGGGAAAGCDGGGHRGGQGAARGRAAVRAGAQTGGWRLGLGLALRPRPVCCPAFVAAPSSPGPRPNERSDPSPAQVPGTGQDALYVTGRLPGGAGAPPTQLLLELRLSRGVPGVDAAFKCTRPDLAPFVFDAVGRALKA